MTRVENLSIRLSANELFKRQYGRALRWSLLVAVLLTIAMWMSMPRYEPAPYVLRDDYIKLIYIEEVPPVIEEERPIAAPPMVKNLEPVDNLDPEAEEFPDFIWPVEEPELGCGCLEPDQLGGFVASSSNPMLQFQAKPDYPQMARMSGIEGTVVVAVLVGPNGTVEAARIEQAAHPMLNAAAMAAAFRCRFAPGTQRTIPVQAWVSVPYRFRLH